MRDIRTSRRAVMCALAVTPLSAIPAVKAATTNELNGFACGPTSSNDPAWRRLVAEYHAAVRAHAVHPCGTTLPGDPMHEQWEAEGDVLLDASCRALDRVMEYPAIDNAMLAEKMEIVAQEYGGEDFMSFILSDVRRLAGRAS